MTPTAVCSAIHDVVDRFTVDAALSPARIEECRRLMYGALPVGGHEPDEFDRHSEHIALVCRSSGAVMAAVRLVLPVPGRPDCSFPLQLACRGHLPPGMPAAASAEVSRFAISREERRHNETALMRLALFQGLIRASAGNGLTHWCAALEPGLLRLLEMTAVHLIPFGLTVADGLQPCWNSIHAVLAGVLRDRPPIWEYLTENGRIWPGALAGMRAAS
jgi:hypothetical protein